LTLFQFETVTQLSHLNSIQQNTCKVQHQYSLVPILDKMSQYTVTFISTALNV